MRKAYLFVYSDQLGTRDEVKSILDRISHVITWRYELPNSFYLISEADAGTLSKEIRRLAENTGRFIVAETSDNKQGWLTEESWYLLNYKQHKPK